MKKILLTGWNGFLGLNLTKLLLDESWLVIGMSRTAPDYAKTIKENPNFLFFKADISEYNEIRKCPEFDLIVHLAGNVSAKSSFQDPRSDFKKNVLGTFNILEICRERGEKPLIHASTAKIHPIRDLISRSLYGTSKLSADFYVQEYNLTYGIPIIINRFVTLYGPGQYKFGQPDVSWVNWFIEANLTREPIQLAGAGDQIRDPLYVEDAALLIKKQISHPEMFGHIYDVGAGERNAISPKEVVESIIKITGNDFINIKIRDKRQDEKDKFVADISKLKPYWQPQYNFKDGLLNTYKWMKDVLK